MILLNKFKLGSKHNSAGISLAIHGGSIEDDIRVLKPDGILGVMSVVGLIAALPIAFYLGFSFLFLISVAVCLLTGIASIAFLWGKKLPHNRNVIPQ